MRQIVIKYFKGIASQHRDHFMQKNVVYSEVKTSLKTEAYTKLQETKNGIRWKWKDNCSCIIRMLSNIY